jgi:hypothetical protein
MRGLLQFIARISVVFYAIVGAGIFLSLGGLIRARRARRLAMFGLEREAAQRERRRSVNTIFSLVLVAGAVYIITNIVVPNLGEPPDEPTPTPFVFVTQEPTPTEMLLLFPTITPTPGIAPAEAAEASPESAEPINGCEIIGARITSPTPGQTVSGQVSVEGEANILNFAQYKFELKGPATGGAWVVVGSYANPQPAGFLGTWDATSLIPGDYTLRLVVSKVDGTYLTPCEVPIVIAGSGG